MAKKATNKKLTVGYLKGRAEGCMAKGFKKQKWVEFCETLMTRGFELELYEARRTVSKYILVKRESKTFRVRFSNHKPISERELAGDCDFFVGITHTGTRTTADALKAVDTFFTQVKCS
jgi:hypothetical protein